MCKSRLSPGSCRRFPAAINPGENSPEYRAPEASDEDPLAGTRALPFTPMTIPDSLSFRPERSPLHAERAPDRSFVEGVLTATAKVVAGEPVASLVRAAGEPAAPHISSGLWTGAKASAPHVVRTGATTLVRAFPLSWAMTRTFLRSGRVRCVA